MDMMGLIREAASKVENAKNPSEKFDIRTLLKNESAEKYKKISNLTVLSRNYETLFLRCGEFILMLLDEVQETM
jgi:hypothetical protein